MERKYKLTILPLFEEELNHIVDYITYVLHNREAAHQLITDIEGYRTKSVAINADGTS